MQIYLLHPKFSPALEKVSHPLEREPEADVGYYDDGHGDPHLDVVRAAGGGAGEARDGEHDDDDAVDGHEEERGQQQLVVLQQSCQRTFASHILEKSPTWSFSFLKAPTNAFTINHLC